MSAWFDGKSEIPCTIDRVKRATEDLGAHYREVIGLMPGMTTVDLVDHGGDFVTIRTNEGLMKRTNIAKTVEADRVVLEFDEEYQAGSRVTTRSHMMDEFSTSGDGVVHRSVITAVEGSGMLGFLYRTFGSANIGNAFLSAYREYFARPSD